MKHQYKGFRRILSAFKNSFDGLVYVFREEEAFRQDVFLFVVSIPFIFLFDFSVVERLMLFSSVFLILFAEVVNSVAEAVVDRISAEWHKLSKAVKDMGSFLVFLSFVYFFVVWVSLFAKFL